MSNNILVYARYVHAELGFVLFFFFIFVYVHEQLAIADNAIVYFLFDFYSLKYLSHIRICSWARKSIGCDNEYRRRVS